MQPKTLKKLDGSDFARVKRHIQASIDLDRSIASQPSYATDLPLEIGFQLTNRCNLRCVTCFQWNETGFHKHFEPDQQRADLDIEIFRRVLRETRSVRSTVYLWGGEPLIYNDWEEVTNILQEDPRRVILSTNGLSLASKLSTILPISQELVCLVSIDGFQPENDAIRGKNTFSRALDAIHHVVEEKRRGTFRGQIGISCIISASIVPRLFEFVEYFESVGLDSLYLVFPWYIPSQTGFRMDRYFKDNFSWLREHHPELIVSASNSWHSYNFHLSPELVEELKLQMHQVFARTWKTRVRFQPEMDMDEIDGFVLGSEQPVQGRRRCLSVASRLNVMPDGGVTTCKLFPEFRFGNLTGNSVADVWHSLAAKRTRSLLSEGLTPICSKCVQLYFPSA